MIDIKNLSREKLKALLLERGYPAYTSQQVFQWVYKNRCEDFERMTNIAQPMRVRLKKDFFCSHPVLLASQQSGDGTRKFLFELSRDTTIETVLIPEGQRNTLCVSTQVGCSRGCRFCVSGTLGLKRNLLPGEIVNQYLAVSDLLVPAKVNNVVCMGIGEPLDNLGNLIETITILQDTQGIGLTPRKICVSTIGITSRLAELNRLAIRFRLSVSLHCADQKKRDWLMPATKKYPLGELLPQLRLFAQKKDMPVTLEYILIDGINCEKEDAFKLVAIARKLSCKINVIPYNQSAYFAYRPPDPGKIRQFQSILKDHGIVCTLRTPRGQDIQAACGQLKAEFNTGHTSHDTRHTQGMEK
ncbi:MAG: 23S rRNA (adenine(2503)-C(2))-methyltransferase RlmN [Candidatus Omnitrophica bacterium]|nr:23S rRNA (adenine(2503)-C(2))-methyltransferase RlmN [Candidatus Omnitrophota bacterium]